MNAAGYHLRVVWFWVRYRCGFPRHREFLRVLVLEGLVPLWEGLGMLLHVLFAIIVHPFLPLATLIAYACRPSFRSRAQRLAESAKFTVEDEQP